MLLKLYKIILMSTEKKIANLEDIIASYEKEHGKITI